MTLFLSAESSYPTFTPTNGASACDFRRTIAASYSTCRIACGCPISRRDERNRPLLCQDRVADNSKRRELAGNELHGAVDMDAFQEQERRMRCADCGKRAVSEPIFHGGADF